MNVAVALLSALVVLPPMLVWADQRNWVSKGLVKPEHLVNRDPEPSLADSISSDQLLDDREDTEADLLGERDLGGGADDARHLEDRG